ncbi:MAG: DUF4082 domain-containing protein [Reinekea sp.]
MAISISNAGASVIGVDLASGRWAAATNDNWTLGYEFSIDSQQTVDGLGFWDADGKFNTTNVGLWDTNGTLLGQVDSASTVDTFATGNGRGYWNFIDFDYTLAAGDYVVGAWGDGMEYTYSSGGTITESILEFQDGREKAGGYFQFPDNEYCGNCKGIFGANIRFAEVVNVPEPGSFALLGVGVVGIFLSRKKKSRLG